LSPRLDAAQDPCAYATAATKSTCARTVNTRTSQRDSRHGAPKNSAGTHRCRPLVPLVACRHDMLTARSPVAQRGVHALVAVGLCSINAAERRPEQNLRGNKRHDQAFPRLDGIEVARRVVEPVQAWVVLSEGTRSGARAQIDVDAHGLSEDL
jgi:hypothetical protein